MTSIGKGTAMFVDFDLRHGLTGQLSWGIHGYNMRAAMQFVDGVLEFSN